MGICAERYNFKTALKTGEQSILHFSSRDDQFVHSRPRSSLSSRKVRKNCIGDIVCLAGAIFTVYVQFLVSSGVAQRGRERKKEARFPTDDGELSRLSVLRALEFLVKAGCSSHAVDAELCAGDNTLASRATEVGSYSLTFARSAVADCKKRQIFARLIQTKQLSSSCGCKALKLVYEQVRSEFGISSRIHSRIHSRYFDVSMVAVNVNTFPWLAVAS